MSVSTLRWLDHDAEQARRSAELVKALTEPDTVDSLGIGTIRDGFANVFFPGTSTIQTRARYFLLAPWALQLVDRWRPRDRAQYNRFLDDIETSTIESLLAGNPGEFGIIGSQRRRATKRKAVSVYWTGLGEWGIRADAGMTMASHREHVLTRNRRSGGGVDDEASTPYQVWDETPLAPEGFPDEPTSLLPTAQEAEYLLVRMSGTTAGGLNAPQLVHVNQLIARAGLDVSQVIVTQRITDHELCALYGLCKAHILPTYCEGFGFTALEAMACGVPVLTSNTTSLPEAAGDAALLVDPNSVEQISAGIERLCSDQELRAGMIERGFIQATRFTWEMTTSRVSNVLREIDRKIL